MKTNFVLRPKSRRLPTFLLSLFTLLFVACSTDNESIEEPTVDNQELNIIQVLDAYEQNANARGNNKIKFRTLKVALAQTGLMSTVVTSELTLFAPTDDAFGELGINQTNVGDVPDLTNILLYHVLGGRVFSSDLETGFVESLSGGLLFVNLEDGVFVNDAEVISADNESQNAVIHAVDKVLLPQTILDVAASMPENFSILATALEYTGLDAAVNGTDPLTVFAPVNSAFEAAGITAENITTFEESFIANVLTYHVLGGIALASDLESGFISALNGQTLQVKVSDDGVIINDSDVIIPNVTASNGVIHVIDEVLLPQSIFDIAQRNSELFSILISALEYTGLDAALTGEDPLTVFAPVNAAFEDLGITEENMETQDVDFITNVLLYHVVAGSVTSSYLANGNVETLNGSSFTVSVDDLAITGNGGSVSNLVGPLDIIANNGVIHVIDTVILP